MRWNNLFVCDHLFKPLKNEFEVLCDSDQMKTIIKERLEALDDDKLFHDHLSNQTTFEEILQLCMYGISFDGRDTALVIKSANLLKEILINIWSRHAADRQLSPTANSPQLTRLSLGEYLLKIYEGGRRVHPSLPAFVLYERAHFTKLILSYLVYVFVPVTDDYLLTEQQSKMCVDLLALILEIVSKSEAATISRYHYDQDADQLVGEKQSPMAYDRSVIVDDELLYLICDFFVVSIANWTCQRTQFHAINLHSTQLEGVVGCLFRSLFHVWFTLSIRAFPVNTQWKNLRNLLFMNLYRPSVIGEWSKLMIFITRVFVMKLTVDCERVSQTPPIDDHSDWEKEALTKQDAGVCWRANLAHSLNSCNAENPNKAYNNSVGVASTFVELFLSSPLSQALTHSTTILHLWFRFLFMLDDPTYFMNHTHYFQEAFVISDRSGALDLGNAMIETCVHINKNTMHTYFPMLEKYLPITFNRFMCTIELIMNILFFNRNIPIYETDASLESIISLSNVAAANDDGPSGMAFLKNSRSQTSLTSTSNLQKKASIALYSAQQASATSDNQITIQPTDTSLAHPSICVSSCGLTAEENAPIKLEKSNIISYGGYGRPESTVCQQKPTITVRRGNGGNGLAPNNRKNRYSVDSSQIRNLLQLTTNDGDQYTNDEFIGQQAGAGSPDHPPVFNVDMIDPLYGDESGGAQPAAEDENKAGSNLGLGEFVSETGKTGGSSVAEEFCSTILQGKTTKSETHKLRKSSKSTRPASLYSVSANPTLPTRISKTVSFAEHEYSVSSDGYELAGLNMKKLVKDINIRLCLAGRVRAASIVKIINPWLTNFLIPTFNSDESQVMFHRFLLEKACIMLTDLNHPVYSLLSHSNSTNNSAIGGTLNELSDSQIGVPSISLLCGSKEGYAASTKSSLFHRIQSNLSFFNEDWVYYSKGFQMNNSYELGSATIVKLVCYLLCDFATSHLMSTQNLVNMYTLINMGLCFQMNNSNVVLAKIIQYFNILFQSDLKGSYMLIPMTYNAINVLLTRNNNFNQQPQATHVSAANGPNNNEIQMVADEKNPNSMPVPQKAQTIFKQIGPDIDLKHNTLKALLSLLNFPFHEYSLLFDLERRFKCTTNSFCQVELLSQKYSAHKTKLNVSYLFVNSTLVESILHTLRVFVCEHRLVNSEFSILLSCISTLFWNCVSLQQKLANKTAMHSSETVMIDHTDASTSGGDLSNCGATVVVVTEKNYSKEIFTGFETVIGGGGGAGLVVNAMPKDCIESKVIFKMSVEMITDALNEISSQKQFDLTLAIAVINFLSAFSTVNIKFLDKEACLRLVRELCHFISVQATKPPIYHNKQLHSTILVALQCISKWLLLQPWIMDDQSVRSGVLAVVEHGIFGQVTNPDTKESLNHQTQVRQSISFRVGEMAQTVIQLLFSSRHYNNQSISQYHHVNEETILDEINGLISKNAHSSITCKKQPQFFYFIYQRSILISFVEFPCSPQRVKGENNGSTADLMKPLGLIIFRSASGKKVFQVEFDPVGNCHSSYISSLKSYQEPGLKKTSKHNLVDVEKASESDKSLAASKTIPQPKEYFHFQPSNRTPQSLIPHNYPTYQHIANSYLSKQQFLNHRQSENRVYSKQRSVSYLDSNRLKCPPQILNKYNTLKMFLSQLNIIDSCCRLVVDRDTSADATHKPDGTADRHGHQDHHDNQQLLIVPSLPSYDYKQLELVTTSDTAFGKKLSCWLSDLDNISNRRTETVFVFYVKQQKAKTNSLSPLPDESDEENTLHNDSRLPSKCNRMDSVSDKEKGADRFSCGESFNNFLNSIGTCVNSRSHKKWAGAEARTDIGVGFDFIYREDWTCETAVFVDPWIPMVAAPRKNSSLSATTILTPEDNKTVDDPNEVANGGDNSCEIISSSITAKKSIKDVFAVVWLDNFDYFQFVSIDQMVTSLINRSNLHPKFNVLRYAVFLRHMRNGLICIHTFYKSEFLWKPYNNSSIPCGLVVHPDNLTTVLFNGINSIGILNELKKDQNIDPFSKRKHFIQQLISSIQKHLANNPPPNWLDSLV